MEEKHRGMSPDLSWAAELLETMIADLALCPGSADSVWLLSIAEPL